jgi:hypothetical protein
VLKHSKTELPDGLPWSSFPSANRPQILARKDLAAHLVFCTLAVGNAWKCCKYDDFFPTFHMLIPEEKLHISVVKSRKTHRKTKISQ